MDEMNVPTSKIRLREYFSELRNSQIGVSPFGVGEITLRDFEIIICGAVLVKPDMSHMQTWPALFQPGENYIPHKWDLSDLKEKLEELTGNTELRIRLAMDAQKIYKDAVSPAGLANFADRLIGMIK
jgi:hypothetical protein